MKIFTPCWGDKHINLLDKALGLSFSWPKNKIMVQDAEWLITTQSKHDAERITPIISRISPKGKYRIYVVEQLQIPGVDSGRILIQTLREAVKVCLAENEPMLMATPDFIYGDGTLQAFDTLASEPDSCVTIAHLRVVPHILGELSDKAPSNKKLMSSAWRHAHISWNQSDSLKKPGMSYHGGIKWWNLGNANRAVQHHMPSPFYYRFTEKDLEHFNETHEGKPPGFGIIDHVWPSHLLDEGRLRFIGSSEAAMMIEVTDPEANVPPWNQEGQKGFFRNHMHNKIQSQFISIFQGEDE